MQCSSFGAADSPKRVQQTRCRRRSTGLISTTSLLAGGACIWPGMAGPCVQHQQGADEAHLAEEAEEAGLPSQALHTCSVLTLHGCRVGRCEPTELLHCSLRRCLGQIAGPPAHSDTALVRKGLLPSEDGALQGQ